jgi:hypothetical protein
MLVIGYIYAARRACFTSQVTPAGPPRNPYDVPIVRHRWIFVAGIVFWIVMVVGEIAVAIYNLQNHVSFGITFWIGPAALFFLAGILTRARRLRRAAALQAQSHY